MENAKTRNKLSGTAIFYIIYGAFSVLLLLGVLSVLLLLNQWLVEYQASQPETRSQQVFQELFAQPDWAELYTLAGLEDSPFEDKDSFAQYMNEKVNGQALTYSETAAGLSGDHKYIVRLDQEKLASFTLTGGGSQAQIGHWELGKVELMDTQGQSVTVEKLPGHSVFVNGVALDDSYTIKKTTAVAQDYLPEGLYGYSRELQQVGDLYMTPTVSCTDEQGNDVPMTLDEDGIYRPQLPQPEAMTKQQEELALNAAKTYARYSIQAVGNYSLQQYFDPKSEIYKQIISTPLFARDYKSFSFQQDSIKVYDYYRYSDELYSVHVELTLQVYLQYGQSKVFPSSRTYFFTKQQNGSYMVTDITNIPAQQLREQVLLTFVHNGQVIHSTFAETTAKSVTLPQVEAPEGHVLKGWVLHRQNSTIPVLDPNGLVTLDTGLEPATLYPVFERAE